MTFPFLQAGLSILDRGTPLAFAHIGRFDTVLATKPCEGTGVDIQGSTRILVAFVHPSRTFDLFASYAFIHSLLLLKGSVCFSAKYAPE
jgi:hypothetical protein